MWGSRISSIPGSNSKMNEYSAAIGLASIDSWPKTRIQMLQQVTKAKELSRSAGLTVNKSIDLDLISPYWILQLESESRVSDLISILENYGIDWRRWWEFGCHKMAAYENQPTESMLKTEEISRLQIGLPMHSKLSNLDWEVLDRALSCS